MTYRSGKVTPITWTIVVMVFAMPAVVAITIGILHDDNLGLGTGLAISGCWIAFVWTYFITLKITIIDNVIAKSSIFRSTSVPLTETTLIRHRSETIALNGINFSELAIHLFGKESAIRTLVEVKNSDSRVKVGSAIKGITELASWLVEFESDFIRPSLERRILRGERIKLGNFQFENGWVTHKGQTARLPLEKVPTISNGVLRFRIGNKSHKEAIKHIWNPVCVLTFLTKPPSEVQNSAREHNS